MVREALAGSRLNVAPKAPGFVSAHWLEPIDGVGMSIIVVESKEHADKAAVYRSRYCRASRR